MHLVQTLHSPTGDMQTYAILTMCLFCTRILSDSLSNCLQSHLHVRTQCYKFFKVQRTWYCFISVSAQFRVVYFTKVQGLFQCLSFMHLQQEKAGSTTEALALSIVCYVKAFLLHPNAKALHILKHLFLFMLDWME